MAHDPNLLDCLESLDQLDWEGDVYRFTLVHRAAHRENVQGARWNPPDVPAIYTALDAETVRAELVYALTSWSPRPKLEKFVLHRIHVVLRRVVDLRSQRLLQRMGLEPEALASEDMKACQAIGHAAHWLSVGGLLVPSARNPEGCNLVVFPDKQPADFVFEVVETKPVESC